MMIIYIILFIILLCFIVSYILFNVSLNRYVNKNTIFNNDLNGIDKNIVKEEEPDIEWFNSKVKNVCIISEDNLRLQGYVLKNKINNYILLVHGYTSDHNALINKAKKFYELGFSILLVDLRSHGKSDGKYITMGVKDSEDIKLWIKYLKVIENSKYIGLFGISMGGATVMTSMNDLPSEVKFVIEDCGYTSVWEEFKYQLNNLFHLPTFPFLYICELYAKIFAKYDFKSYSSIKSISNTKIPLLMIHGSNDTFVPYYMFEKIYKSCSSKKDKLVVKGANHTQAELLDSNNYWKKIVEFIKEI